MADHFGTNGPLIQLLTVDSTNNYARSLIHEGLAQHGLGVFALEQTAGRGQPGRSWKAESGKNIQLTVLLKPQSPKQTALFPLMAALALGVYDFFQPLAGDDTRIKWANDLYWQDRKAGGILVENTGSQTISVSGRKNPVNESREWVLAGIGININQTVFPEELLNPVSLKQITGKDFDILALAEQLREKITHQFDSLLYADPARFTERYNEVLYKKNEVVKFRKENRVFAGKVIGVNGNGNLVVDTGMVEEFRFGEIQWNVAG